MRRLRFLNAVLMFHFIFLFSLHAANKPLASVSPALPEIHLLVDVSGSMKKTDPQNLRVKAINMFIYLIKQKALMQIQTFATDTQLMIPLKPVTGSFQNEYKKKSYRISSNGQFTDIDSAVNQANRSWGLGKKIIILLTDGAVDLGSKFRTAQSKNKLAESTLKSLHQNGVRVFTIGFSKNADKALLDNLALKTNGISQVVNESKDLDNVLYSIFTAIITVNGTPVTVDKDSSRTIKIDKNIHALTLILKKTGSISQLFLIDPKGRKKNIVDLSNKDASTTNYLFVDINNPIAGKWILTGPKQEIERAIILTDVNLVSNFISGTYFQGEVISLNCHFSQLGETISSPIITENTSVNAQFESNTKNYSYKIPYEDMGVYRKKITIDHPVGFYRIILAADNKFLSRELQFVIDIYESPIIVSNSDSKYNLKLVRTDLLKEDTVSVNLKFKSSPLILEAQKRNDEWTIDLFTACSNPSLIKDAHVYFTGRTINERSVKLRLSLPDNICANGEQFKSEIPAVQLASPSLIQKIPIQQEKIEKKKNSLLFTILLYSIIILLLITIILIIGVFFSGIKYGKKIERLKKQLQSENNDEQL